MGTPLYRFFENELDLKRFCKILKENKIRSNSFNIFASFLELMVNDKDSEVAGQLITDCYLGMDEIKHE